MPAACAYQFIVVAQRGTDDSNSLVHILTVVIMLAVVVIGNIAQAKKKARKKPHARHRADQPPPGDHASDQQMEEALDLPRREKPRPAAYAPGGFGEVLEEDDAQTLPRKTALERFVAMKDVPVEKLERSPVTAINGLDIEGGEKLERLDDIHEEKFEIAGVDGSAAIFVEDALAFDLSFENLGDAILYGEILGKPVALRGTERAGSGSI
ncbi:MAG: hypothetical protein IIA65_07815 [Planctomycetes bacterium]|nr:hypothetical protein [Planctomycetota bacterium]